MPLLVGSNQFRQTSAAEARWLVADGLLPPRALLAAWMVTTPRAVFPGRRVGGLADGDEGSLLVLAGDPLRDVANTGRTRLRIKQGVLLASAAP